MENKAIIGRFINMKRIYCMQSPTTHHPFVEYSEKNEGEQVMIFGDRDEAEHFVQIYQARHYATELRVIEQKQYKDFYTELGYIGVDTIVFMEGEDENVVPLTDVIKIELKDVGNPDLPRLNELVQLTMIYYLEEYTRPGLNKDDPDRKEKIADLREEMEANLKRSKFILPMIQTKAGSGVMMLKNSKNENLQPVFTDVRELQIFLQNNKVPKVGMMLASFDDLKKAIMDDAKAFVVNPSGVNMILPRSVIQ